MSAAAWTHAFQQGMAEENRDAAGGQSKFHAVTQASSREAPNRNSASNRCCRLGISAVGTAPRMATRVENDDHKATSSVALFTMGRPLWCSPLPAALRVKPGLTAGQHEPQCRGTVGFCEEVRQTWRPNFRSSAGLIVGRRQMSVVSRHCPLGNATVVSRQPPD